MGIAEEVRGLLKSTEKRSELGRIQKLIEDKKARGIIIEKASVVPNLQDAERHSRDFLFGNWLSQ